MHATSLIHIPNNSYFISSVLKLTMVEIKLSLMVTERMLLHSVAFSPSSRHIDSKASLMTAGGLAIDRTSTRCCFFIDFTAKNISR